MNVPRRPRVGQVRWGRLGLQAGTCTHTHAHAHTHTHTYRHTRRSCIDTGRVSVRIERRAVSEPSSPAYSFLHLSFSRSDISPLSSNHFLPLEPLFLSNAIIPHSSSASSFPPLLLQPTSSSPLLFSGTFCMVFGGGFLPPPHRLHDPHVSCSS